jgi:hypothetical protein
LVSGEDRSDEAPKTSKSSKSGGGDKAIGDALRNVYQNAIDEHVPDEMLDLLRKLD